jgi:hypothetical protein
MKPSHPPTYKFICSHVFVDTADRSAYTRADSPSLDGACPLPLWVSPLRPREGSTPMKLAPTTLFSIPPAMTEFAARPRFFARPQLLTRA